MVLPRGTSRHVKAICFDITHLIHFIRGTPSHVEATCFDIMSLIPLIRPCRHQDCPSPEARCEHCGNIFKRSPLIKSTARLCKFHVCSINISLHIRSKITLWVRRNINPTVLRSNHIIVRLSVARQRLARLGLWFVSLPAQLCTRTGYL